MISIKAVNEFQDFIYAEAAKRFGTDEEGDPVVQIRIIELDRHQHSHYIPIQRRHTKRNASIKDMLAGLVEAGINLQIAQGEVSRIICQIGTSRNV